LMAHTASPKSGDIGIIPEMYKAKAISIYAMKTLGGEGVQLLLIIDLGTGWGMSGQRHAPTAFYPRGKDPQYPLYRRLRRPQSRSGHRGQRKNPFASAGDRTSIA
jgi:hypothetical protein